MKKVVNLAGRSDYEILTSDHPQMLARGLKLPIYTCRLYNRDFPAFQNLGPLSFGKNSLQINQNGKT